MSEGPEENQGEKESAARYPLERSQPGLADKQPSPYSCPECGGVLWEEDEGQLYGYRCRVGHVYSYDALLAGQTDQVERALWAGLRALEEKQSLLTRLAERSRERGLDRAAGRFEDTAKELGQPAGTLRRLLKEDGVFGLPQRETGNGGESERL